MANLYRILDRSLFCLTKMPGVEYFTFSSQIVVLLARVQGGTGGYREVRGGYRGVQGGTGGTGGYRGKR